VREATARGERILYGDASRKEVLHHVRLERARTFVIAISDPVATRRTVSLAREMNSDIHIIVRTRYMSEITDLRELGADEVIPEEFETSVEIFTRVLREYGIGRRLIQQQVEEVRSESYRMLRSPSLPQFEINRIAEALGSASTETLFLEGDAVAVGKSIRDLRLRTETGATLIAVAHDQHTILNPDLEFILRPGHLLVLLGSPEQIDRAIEHINSGTGSAEKAETAGAG
jgi:CPA2 family monovalent cation:H+ antiporter-2